MDELFVEIEIVRGNKVSGETKIYTSIESFLAIYVFKYLCLTDDGNVKLRFVSNTLPKNVGKLMLNTNSLRTELTEQSILCKDASCIESINDLRLPIYRRDVNTYICGMCAVCRELVARQAPEKQRRKLLGFKEGCLLAPSEVSIWTRFCELDIIDALKQVLNTLQSSMPIKTLPKDVTRFEKHMNEPCRMHNIYKEARVRAKKNDAENLQPDPKQKGKVIRIESNTPMEQLNIKHRFAEGVNFTIADLLLYPCMSLILEHCSKMVKNFPLIAAWFNEIESTEPSCSRNLKALCDLQSTIPEVEYAADEIKITDCVAASLYKSDPKRYKPKSRIYTEQSKVDAAINKLQCAEIQELNFNSDSHIEYGQQTIDWNAIEPRHQESSALPQERLKRKRQQLENLANAIISLANDGDRIVDFCSGTGHLGLLLALKLSKCTIILMENKPFSLERAKKRALELKLENVRFYQCNIDYFVGTFDLGTSLHACGTATDIVLQHCRRSKAKFVCCPCCYGKCEAMPHISYPLSKAYRNALSEEDYLYLAHAADQSHELGTRNCTPEMSSQGQLCMDIVDTDRKFLAEEMGYKVILTRLKPEKCTPKNRLLVGWIDKKS